MKRRQRTISVIGASLALVLAGCGGGSEEASAEEFCDLAEDANDASDDVDAAFDSGDPGDIEDAINDAIAAAEAAVDAAPDDIKPVAETVLEAQQDLANVLEDYDWDIEAAATDEGGELMELIEDDSIQEASDELDDYLDDECGIEQDDTSEDTGSDTTEEASGDLPVTTEVMVEETIPVDTTVAEDVAATLQLDAEVGGTTVGTEDSPSAVYAAILTNSTDDPVSNLEISFTIFGADDLVVGTGSTYVDMILPGQTRAVTSTASLTAPAARIEANYSGDVQLPYGIDDISELPVGEFTFEGVSLTGDDYSTGVIGLMKSSYPVAFENVEVVAIFRDAAGAIVGGGLDYVTVLENGQVGVEPSAYYQIPNVATFELFASYPSYELTD